MPVRIKCCCFKKYLIAIFTVKCSSTYMYINSFMAKFTLSCVFHNFHILFFIEMNF